MYASFADTFFHYHFCPNTCVQVEQATKKVVLNSAEIEISSAQLAGGESESNTTLLQIILIDMAMARETYLIIIWYWLLKIESQLSICLYGDHSRMHNSAISCISRKARQMEL